MIHLPADFRITKVLLHTESSWHYLLHIFTVIGNKEKLSYVLQHHLFFSLLNHESLFCFFQKTILEQVFLSTLFE